MHDEQCIVFWIKGQKKIYFLNVFCRLFVLKMNWNVILQSNLGMLMPRYISVKRIVALGPCVTSKMWPFTWIVIDVLCFPVLTSYIIIFPRAYGSGKEDSPMCDVPGFENSRMKLLRHVSFVDCPVRFLVHPFLVFSNCISFFTTSRVRVS